MPEERFSSTKNSRKSNQDDSENVKNPPQSSPFDNIPDELLLMVFSYFSQVELVKICAPVCHRWCNVSMTDCFWKKLSFDSNSSTKFVKRLLSCARKPISLEINERDDILSYKNIILKRVRELEHLSITYCGTAMGDILSDFLICLMSRARKLKSLDLEGTRGDSPELFRQMALLPNLTTLNVKRVARFSMAPDLLAALPKLARLNSLRVSWLMIKYPEDSLSPSKRYKHALNKFLLKLQSSSLMHLEIFLLPNMDESSSLFSRCQQLRSLQIHKAACDLTPQGLKAIGTLENLKSLYIDDSQNLNANDLTQAFKYGKLHNLTTFGMPDCQIKFSSTNDVVLLSAIGKCCSSLRNVCLSQNIWLTREGIIALANNCPTLRILDVSGCWITHWWDFGSLKSVMRDLEDLIIDKILRTEITRILLKWETHIPFPRVTYIDTYQEYRPHKVFFEH